MVVEQTDLTAHNENLTAYHIIVSCGSQYN